MRHGRMSAPPMKNLAGTGQQAGMEREAARKAAGARKPAPPSWDPRRVSRKLLQGGRPPLPQLPAGWHAYWDDQYQMYYYHDEASGVTQWDPPPAPHTANGGAHDAHDAHASVDDHGASDTHAGEHTSDGQGGAHADGSHSTGSHSGEHGVGDAHGGEHDEDDAPIIDVFLFEFGDDAWQHCTHTDLACLRDSSIDEVLLGRYQIKDEEQAILMEFHLKDDSKDQFFVVISEHPEPLAIAINMHSLGFTGSSQVPVIMDCHALSCVMPAPALVL